MSKFVPKFNSFVLITTALTTLLLFISCNTNSTHKQQEIVNEIDSLLDLTSSCLRRIQIDSAEMHIDKALELCKKVNYSEGCMDTYIFKGQILYYENSLQESLKYLLMAEKEPFAKQNPMSLYEIHRIKGQIFLRLNLLNQTIKEFGKALSLVPKSTSPIYRANISCMIYENLTTAYGLLGDTIKEFQILNKYKNIAKKTEEVHIYPYKVNAYNKIANYFMKKNQIDSTRYYLFQAIAVADRNSYPYYSNSYITLGECALIENQIDSALHYFKKALVEVEARRLKNDYKLIYNKMAIAFEAAQMADSARVYRDKYIQYENLLAQDNVDAVETTVNAISEEQEGKFKSRIRLYMYIGFSVIGLVLLFLLLNHYFYRRQIKRKDRYVKDLTKKANDAFDDIVQLAKNNDSAFLTRFSEVYAEFMNALMQKHPNLNRTDLTFCAMKYLGFDTKEIAVMTFVEVRSIQTRRSRLRKKMNLSPDTDIYQYLHSLGGNN